MGDGAIGDDCYAQGVACVGEYVCRIGGVVGVGKGYVGWVWGGECCGEEDGER